MLSSFCCVLLILLILQLPSSSGCILRQQTQAESCYKPTAAYEYLPGCDKPAITFSSALFLICYSFGQSVIFPYLSSFHYPPPFLLPLCCLCACLCAFLCASSFVALTLFTHSQLILLLPTISNSLHCLAFFPHVTHAFIPHLLCPAPRGILHKTSHQSIAIHLILPAVLTV